MGKNHLTYFKVDNFKRFDTLELNDIGQFNLIVGDNNVGKTSVLEALLFDTDRKNCLLSLHKTLFLKGLVIRPKMIYGTRGEIAEVQYPDENFLRYLFKKLDEVLVFSFKNTDGSGQWGNIHIQMSKPPPNYDDQIGLNFESVHFTGNTPDNRYIKFENSGVYYISFVDHPDNPFEGLQEVDIAEIAGIYEHLLSQNIDQWDLPFITTSFQGSKTLPKFYFEQVNLSRKEKVQLIEDMRFLLPEIEDFEVRKIGGEDQLLVGMKGRDELMPIGVFGESVTRATQILLEISKYRGKRLMIDEIDTGIHYSRMKTFLKTVFQVAFKNDVQLFMTTHSLECQQAFAELFDDPDMVQHQAKAKQFTLLEQPDGTVVANPHSFEQLQHALEIGFDTRGGKRGWRKLIFG